MVNIDWQSLKEWMKQREREWKKDWNGNAQTSFIMCKWQNQLKTICSFVPCEIIRSAWLYNIHFINQCYMAYNKIRLSRTIWKTLFFSFGWLNIKIASHTQPKFIRMFWSYYYYLLHTPADDFRLNPMSRRFMHQNDGLLILIM